MESAQDPRFDAIAESLAKIKQSLNRIGAPLLMVHRSEVDAELVGGIRSVGEREAFSVGSLEIWTDPRWSGENAADFTNSAVDRHCNPKGCELKAIVIHERMIATGLLD
jgi:hypothetical protein